MGHADTGQHEADVRGHLGAGRDITKGLGALGGGGSDEIAVCEQAIGRCGAGEGQQCSQGQRDRAAEGSVIYDEDSPLSPGPIDAPSGLAQPNRRPRGVGAQ